MDKGRRVEVHPADSPLPALAEFVTSAATRELPPEVMQKASLHILDSIAAAVSGMQLAAGRHALAYVTARGAPEQATVYGTSVQTSVPYAAMANGMAAHADETDDSLAPLGSVRTHPGCSVVPSAIAMAEACHSSGMELLRAVTLGYDMCGRFPMALWSDFEGSPEQCGPAFANIFGASAAAGSLIGLTVEQCRYLFAYAVQHASGLKTFFRERHHVEKAYVFGGMPSFNATTNAEMVKAGWTGVEDVFVGSPSFFTLGPCPDPSRLTEELGSRYEVMRTKFKKYPVGSPGQSPLDALLLTLEAEGLTSDDVSHLEVRLSPPRLRTCFGRLMSNLNIEYLMEVALLDGELVFGNAHDEERFQAWRETPRDGRVVVLGDESLGDSHSASVTVTTHDGRTIDRLVKDIPGSPENPMSRADIEKKATGLMEPILGARRTAGLIEDLSRLPELEDVRKLRRWLEVPDGSEDSPERDRTG